MCGSLSTEHCEAAGHLAGDFDGDAHGLEPVRVTSSVHAASHGDDNRRMNASLLARLDAVGNSLAESGHAVALIGLGSAGLETERLDAWSDLDFFAIVEQGHKASYIERLDWLASAWPLVWH